MNITAIVETFIVSLVKYYAITTMFVYIESKKFVRDSQDFLIPISFATELSENCITLCKKRMVFYSFQDEQEVKGLKAFAFLSQPLMVNIGNLSSK